MVQRAAPPDGFAARCTRVLFSPWARLTLLVLFLGAAAALMLLWQPQQLLTHHWPAYLSGPPAAAVYAVVYGVFTVAFVPRPVLNVAAGAVFGTGYGVASALAGTVIGAGLAFLLGRALGQRALRPLLRARWLQAADRQLSDHAFRSVLVIRFLPGVPFCASNYCASVSRMRLTPFLLATALGSLPNTAAYVIAGSRATSPTSPLFLVSVGVIVVPGLVAAVVAWRRRRQLPWRRRGSEPVMLASSSHSSDTADRPGPARAERLGDVA
ncbi:TVP38/TMEM64 family protein [Streptomyces sp. NPDC059740]|uniref:TVP38/TMEM64 family protein n=1 Tax=Streptomyces sp. NPDC059740 TaxID=3346926 RepID=UPI0036473EE0